MSRSVKEWVGKSDDSQVPPRIRLRVLGRYFLRCGRCARTIVSGEAWICDHVVALINGGENRESNLQPLCGMCNVKKNKMDVVLKALTATKAKANYGIKKRKGRPMMGTKASGWKQKMDGSWVKR